MSQNINYLQCIVCAEILCITYGCKSRTSKNLIRELIGNHSINNCEHSLSICIAPITLCQMAFMWSLWKLWDAACSMDCLSVLISTAERIPAGARISNDLDLRAMSSNPQINLNSPIPCWFKTGFKSLFSSRHWLVRNCRAEKLGNVPSSKHKLTSTLNQSEDCE